MFYLNETDEGIDWFSPSCPNNNILEYSTDKEDYFLNYRMIWKEVEADFYEMAMGPDVFYIPSGFFVLIGDVFGELDWIMSDELIGRDLDCVILTPELTAWSLHQPILRDMIPNTMYWPNTKNIVPVRSGKSVILLADKDFYHKTKNDLVSALIV